MHNFNKQERVTVVNRWCPWWLSVDDFAPGSRYNVICRPLSHSEYLALPTELVRHHLIVEVVTDEGITGLGEGVGNEYACSSGLIDWVMSWLRS